MCDDLPDMKAALENNILSDYNTHSYESMRALCDRFNRAIDSVVALVIIIIYSFIPWFTIITKATTNKGVEPALQQVSWF